MQGHGLQWVSVLVREIQAISRKILKRKLVTEGAFRQWCNIMKREFAKRGLPSAIRSLGEEWPAHVSTVSSGRDTVVLGEVGQRAQHMVGELTRMHLVARPQFFEEIGCPTVGKRRSIHASTC